MSKEEQSTGEELAVIDRETRVSMGGEQLTLLAPDSEALAQEVQSGQPGDGRTSRHTGAYLWRTNPELYRRILSMLAAGCPVTWVQEATGVSIHTVYAIRDAHPQLVASVKSLLGNKMRGGALVLAERIMEASASIGLYTAKDVQSAAVTMGILAQRAQELGDDRPTEQSANLPSMRDYREALGGGGEIIEGDFEIVEAEQAPGMGSAGDMAGTKGADQWAEDEAGEEDDG